MIKMEIKAKKWNLILRGLDESCMLTHILYIVKRDTG